MEKIKKILSPGHSKDDEVMYGDSTTSGTTTETSHSSRAADEHTGLNSRSVNPTNTAYEREREHDREHIPTGSAIPSHMSSSGADDAASISSIRSGVVGAAQPPVASSGAPAAAGAHSDVHHSLPDRSAQGVSHGSHDHSFNPVPGPHPTAIANILDPKLHVPGEFPSSTDEEASAAPRGYNNSNTSSGVPEGSAIPGTQHHDSSSRNPALANVPGFEEQRFDPSARSSVPHQSGATALTDEPRTNHHGRNAALGTAAGVAGVEAYEASRDGHGAHPAGIGASETTRGTGSNVQDPASFTTGPHSSNLANIVDPRVRPEPEKMKGHTATNEDPASYTTGPHSSNLANIVDPRVRPEPEKMRGNTTSDPYSETDKSHHYGRDAAIVGGVGAVGATGYEATRNDGLTASQTSQQPYNSSATAAPYQSNTMGRTDPRVDSELSSADKGHHYGRDAAIVGGVGAAGAAGYAATRNDGLTAPQASQQPLSTPTGAPQDARIFDQTQQVPTSRQADGGWAADNKAQEKLQKQQDKDVKAHEKEMAHEQKKAHDKAEKAREKEIAHEQKKKAHELEKAQEKEAKGEKKHGLLGFLHRDKEPKDTAEESVVHEPNEFRERDIQAHQAHQRELEAAAAAGTIGVAGASFEPSLEEQEREMSSSQRVSTDTDGRHRLHKDPPAHVQRELDQKAREHDSMTGTTGTTGTASHTAAGEDGIVTDPHTGLPKNVGKYGSGFGGTDASNTVQHNH